MLPYHLDNNVCPSSLHENEQGELEPISPNATSHKWDDTTDPVTCSECGTTKDLPETKSTDKQYLIEFSTPADIDNENTLIAALEHAIDNLKAKASS